MRMVPIEQKFADTFESKNRRFLDRSFRDQPSCVAARGRNPFVTCDFYSVNSKSVSTSSMMSSGFTLSWSVLGLYPFHFFPWHGVPHIFVKYSSTSILMGIG